jgi:hypothetical protein
VSLVRNINFSKFHNFLFEMKRASLLAGPWWWLSCDRLINLWICSVSWNTIQFLTDRNIGCPVELEQLVRFLIAEIAIDDPPETAEGFDVDRASNPDRWPE